MFGFERAIYGYPEKHFFGDRPPPPPPLLSKGLDDQTPPLSQDLDPAIGNLSNSVVERRTSTGIGPFASLGSGLFETLG